MKLTIAHKLFVGVATLATLALAACDTSSKRTTFSIFSSSVKNFDILGVNTGFTVEEFKKKFPTASCSDSKEFPDPRVFGHSDSMGFGLYIANNAEYERAGIFLPSVACTYSPDQFSNQVSIQFVGGKLRFMKREYEGINQDIGEFQKIIEERTGVSASKFDNCHASGSFDRMWCQQKEGVATYDFVTFDLRGIGHIQMKSRDGVIDPNSPTQGPRSQIASIQFEADSDDLNQTFKKMINDYKSSHKENNDKSQI